MFVGSSIGASTVVDFALHHPEATAKLVLMGPAAWNEGLGVFPRLPRWIASVIAQGLRSKWYRRRSLPDVYFDHALATEDMLRIHTLHTDLPGQFQQAFQVSCSRIRESMVGCKHML